MGAVAAIEQLRQAMREIRPNDPTAQSMREEHRDLVRQVRQRIERVEKAKVAGDAPADEVAEVLAMCKVLERELCGASGD